MKKITQKILSAIALLAFGISQSYAVEPDYSGLTAAASFENAIAAILAVFGVVVALYVIIKGAKLVLSAIKGA